MFLELLWAVFIQCDCPKKMKVATLLLPFLIGPAMVWARAGDATPTFDTMVGECLETWPLPGISEWVVAGILAAIALALAFRLRIVRTQVRTRSSVVGGVASDKGFLRIGGKESGGRQASGMLTHGTYRCKMYNVCCKRKEGEHS